MTQVSGLSSVTGPASSIVPEDKFVNTSRSLQISSSPSPIPGKSSGDVIPNRINMRSYCAGSPLISSQGRNGSSSTSGLMYNSTIFAGISGIGPAPGTPYKDKKP